jgi:hypothetical protein
MPSPSSASADGRGASSRFRARPFDAPLVLAQIAFTTAASHAALGLGLAMLSALFGLQLGADALSFGAWTPWTAVGWLLTLAALGNAGLTCVRCCCCCLVLPCCFSRFRLPDPWRDTTLSSPASGEAPGSALLLAFAVQRSRLCLDFAATAAGVHLLVTCAFSAGTDTPFPGTLWWWCVWGGALALAVAGGEHLCRVRELAPIPVRSGGAGQKSGRGQRRGSRTAGGVRDGGGGGGGGDAMELAPLAPRQPSNAPPAAAP